MYEYKVTQPMIPPDEYRSSTGPIMDGREMEWWLNNMDEKGWEFVGFGEKHWKGAEPFTQTWWIFRKPK